jgi:hypothetical protein
VDGRQAIGGVGCGRTLGEEAGEIRGQSWPKFRGREEEEGRVTLSDYHATGCAIAGPLSHRSELRIRVG